MPQRRTASLIPHSALRTALGVLLHLALNAATASAQNFSSHDPTLSNAAEAARLHSATFWTGHPLPGDWAAPCPITVSQSMSPGTGKTRFTISGGEVFNWQMEVAGTSDSLLDDVIPHEVDHMVRASLCRRALPRWLDEGAAALFESPQVHHQLRRHARVVANRPDLRFHLTSFDYPTSTADSGDMYAAGFSLVEYLLQHGGPRRLLSLQQDSGDLPQAFQALYGQPLAELPTHWRDWLKSQPQANDECATGECLLHRHALLAPPDLACDEVLVRDQGQPANCQSDARPLLTIWTTSWCPACWVLHRDLRSDPTLGPALRARFHIHICDADLAPQAALADNVQALPAFVCEGRTITGYQGPHWLLKQLGLPPTVAQGDAAPTTAPQTFKPPESSAASPPAPIRQPPAKPTIPDNTPPKLTNQRPVDTPVPLPELAQSLLPAVTPVADSKAPVVKPIQTSAAPLHSDGIWTILDPLSKAAPVVLTGLQIIGVIGGTAATGGIGGLALAALFALIRRRRATTLNTNEASQQPAATLRTQEAADLIRAPFPRELDEARQLLEIRQSEGRVAALDAIRGMFLDDELEKLTHDPAAQTFVHRLRTNLQTRIDEVAPLSTKA